MVAKGSGTGIEGLGFAIPIDSVASSIDDIIEHGTITGKPMAGISIYDGMSRIRLRARVPLLFSSLR